ncbi:trypsin-like peptidase domain-containing protein [Ureibacillus manganicus]|uniref:trypsin-like peptidase domain-containing protein n=1 Tax=Ureibacillus manganicus TaxID=1266064 RepID=UPI00068EF870|nr:trypsin-like peptidase domain-containing protein [Ureibacillus manganicus]
MFCPNCGESNEKSSKFCGNCGHSMLNNPMGHQPGGESSQTHDEHSYPNYREPNTQHYEQTGNQNYQQPSGDSFQRQGNQEFQRPFDGQLNQPGNEPFQQPGGTQFQQYNNQQRYQQPGNDQFQQPGGPGFQGNGQFQQPVNSHFQSNSPQRSNPKPPKKNTKVWIISGVAVLLVVILAVSYGLFTYFNGQNNATPLNNNNQIGQTVQGNNNQNNNVNGNEDPEKNDDKNGKDTKEEKVKEVVEQKEKTQIIKESLPKVFTIITQDGHGSGFLYADGGYIVTNAHVVAGFSDVLVRNSAGQESPGKVIGISDTLDIALIQSEEYARTEPLSIENKPSDIGIEVIAIGSPQGFENSASIGYLTGTDREMSIDGYNFVYDELYQIDAQIDQGSSGGPLFDATNGNVIGINSIVYLNYQSFAFAIPVYTVKEYFDNWIKNPMSASEVVSVDVYAGYETNVNDLGEDYSDFWKWYEQYYGEGTDEYVDYDNYLDTYGYYFDETTLTNFINDYFEYYEWSINDGDFYWVEDMISPESNAYLEIERQIGEYYGSGYTFDYLSTEITGIEIFEEEGYAIVTTNEEYDLYDANGEYETYSEVAEYYVVIDEYGYYLISDMYYYEAM